MNSKSFQVIEALCIAGSLFGSVISMVTGQILYASVPLAVALSMNFINRAKLEQQTTKEVTYLSQSIVSLPQLDSSTELSQKISTKAAIEKMEKLEERLNNISKSVEEKLTLVSTKLDVLPGLTELDHKILQIQSYLNLIVSDQLSGFDNNLLAVNKKLESQRQQLEKLLNQVSFYESRIYKLESNNSEDIYNTILIEFKQISRFLNQIQPAYDYSLVCDRLDSRNLLIEAINKSKHRLILVCPWLTNPGFYNSTSSSTNLIQHLELALKRGVTVDIGWGHLGDISSSYQITQMTNREFVKQVLNKNNASGWKYEALEALESLQSQYSTKLNLKLMGTHEKFFICDRSFGIIGSHNFLASGFTSKERELGLRTNDPNIIKLLIERFDSARSLSDISTANYSPSVSNYLPANYDLASNYELEAILDYDIPVGIYEFDEEDIPF